MALDHGELPHYYSPVELSSCMAYNEIKLEASKYYSWAVSPLMRCPPEIQSEICNTVSTKFHLPCKRLKSCVNASIVNGSLRLEQAQQDL